MCGTPGVEGRVVLGPVQWGVLWHGGGRSTGQLS